MFNTIIDYKLWIKTQYQFLLFFIVLFFPFLIGNEDIFQLNFLLFLWNYFEFVSIQISGTHIFSICIKYIYLFFDFNLYTENIRCIRIYLELIIT